MIQRFQIEDLIIQDGSGVVFRALDTETGNPVAVRRFFPFGAAGGGLRDDEQVAYDIAIGRLAGLRHPALRSVICGGCDPIDGIPFIATEWVEGTSLQPILHGGNMEAESAIELIIKALEVSELLSQVLAEEAVWVETDIETIIVGDEASGRGFTFWISPFKWLGDGGNRELESIVTLTEEVMGWTGRVVDDQAGHGLGGWVNWLRNAAATTSLREAREMLVASVGVAPPRPAGKLVAGAREAARKPVKRSGTPLMSVFAILTLVVAVASLGAWLWIRKSAQDRLPALAEATAKVARTAAPPGVSKDPAPSPPRETAAPPAVEETPSPAPESSPTADSGPTPEEPVAVVPEPEPAPLPADPPAVIPKEVEDTNKRIAALSAKLSGDGGTAAAHASQPTLEDLEAQKAAVEKQGGVFSPGHCGLLLQSAGKPVVVQGVFEGIELSQTGKTMYLLFSGDTDWNSARGSVILSKAPADLTESALRPLIGKTIRLRGKVEPQMSNKRSRPLIILTDRASIEVVD